jgi:hypothetical protein
MAQQITAKHKVAAHVIAEDLSEPGAPKRIVDELKKRGIEIEFLVNNAGFGTVGPFAERDTTREMEMVQVNVGALVHLTSLLLPSMVSRGHGRILNVGSVAGFQPGPYMAVYYATKAFVNHFTEALAFELRGTGVTATVSCPGATVTEFAGLAGYEGSRLFQLGAMPADKVAAHGYQAMQHGKPMAIVGLRNALRVMSVRIGTRSFVRSVAARLNEIVQPTAKQPLALSNKTQ